MKKTLATLATLFFAVSSAACADINLYGPGGPTQPCRKLQHFTHRKPECR